MGRKAEAKVDEVFSLLFLFEHFGVCCIFDGKLNV